MLCLGEGPGSSGHQDRRQLLGYTLAKQRAAAGHRPGDLQLVAAQFCRVGQRPVRFLVEAENLAGIQACRQPVTSARLRGVRARWRIGLPGSGGARCPADKSSTEERQLTGAKEDDIPGWTGVVARFQSRAA